MTLQEVITKLRLAEQHASYTPEQQQEHDYITALNEATEIWLTEQRTDPTTPELYAFAEGFFYAWSIRDFS
jgi:hypothetical protein